MNQLVIILYSEQGKGKSSWIRHLLPPEWKEYFYNGIIDPANKDHERLLSTRIIINMEEFEGVKPGELAALKRIIAQDNITQRKAYDVEAFTLALTSTILKSWQTKQTEKAAHPAAEELTEAKRKTRWAENIPRSTNGSRS